MRMTADTLDMTRRKILNHQSNVNNNAIDKAHFVEELQVQASKSIVL